MFKLNKVAGKYPSLIHKNLNDIQSKFVFFRKAEALARRYSVKRLFLNITLNLQENTNPGITFLIHLQPATLKREFGPSLFL